MSLLSRREGSSEPNDEADARPERPDGSRGAHRQGHGARRARLPAGGGGVDRGRTRRRQRRRHRLARAQRHGRRPRHGRRQGAAGARAHAAVPLSQAARPGDHACRPGRPSDHLRGLAKGAAAPGQRGAARPQYRGAHPAHQRRRAGARARAAGDRLAAALSRPRPWPRAAGSARRAARRRQHRRRPLRRDRGAARPRAGIERVAHLRHPRGQEPRGEERARSPGTGGEPVDPGVVRPVPARRARRGRDRGGQDPRAARAARRAGDRVGGSGFFGPDGGEGGATTTHSSFRGAGETREPGMPEPPSVPESHGLGLSDSGPRAKARDRNDKRHKPRRSDAERVGAPELARREQGRGRKPYRGKKR